MKVNCNVTPRRQHSSRIFVAQSSVRDTYANPGFASVLSVPSVSERVLDISFAIMPRSYSEDLPHTNGFETCTNRDDIIRPVVVLPPMTRKMRGAFAWSHAAAMEAKSSAYAHPREPRAARERELPRLRSAGCRHDSGLNQTMSLRLVQ